MKRRTALFAAIAVFILLAAFLLGYRWFSDEPELTVHLKCEENISGKLSAAKIFPNGERGKPENFNLETACQAGKITINNYQREEKIQFSYERGAGGGETHQIISEYGEHIQSDQTGFYAVLKLTLAPPFIIKDKI